MACNPAVLTLSAGGHIMLMTLAVVGDHVIASERLCTPTVTLCFPLQKTKPMAVGGIGMVCTANYNARKFGIRAAMPGFIARRLCPELVFVTPDFQKYTKASQATRNIFRDFDPDFEAGSLDEAYLDITAYCEQHGMTGTLDG